MACGLGMTTGPNTSGVMTTNPAAPARFAILAFSVLMTPPASQMMIFPVTFCASRTPSLAHVPSTSCIRGFGSPMVVFGSLSDSPPSSDLSPSTTETENLLSLVLAPTVSSHGASLTRVAGLGPVFPAAAQMNTPLRIARDGVVGEVDGVLVPKRQGEDVDAVLDGVVDRRQDVVTVAALLLVAHLVEGDVGAGRHAGGRAEPVAEDAGVGYERSGRRARRVRAVLPLADREHRVAEPLPFPLGRLEVGPGADELVVAHRLVEVAAAFPLGRRRLHPGAVEGRVAGVDAVVEDADDDALAHVAGVPQAAAAAPAHEPEHLRRVRGEEVVRLLGEGAVEPVHLGHLLELLRRHAGGEAVDDVAMRRVMAVGSASSVSLAESHTDARSDACQLDTFWCSLLSYSYRLRTMTR
nr:unnamed protein product [Digitaria exilis]